MAKVLGRPKREIPAPYETYDQWRYHTITKFNRPSRRKDKDARCILCTIPLSSKFGGKRRKKYCNDCSKNQSKRLEALYARRSYNRKKGKELPPVVLETVLAVNNRKTGPIVTNIKTPFKSIWRQMEEGVK